MNIFGIFIGFLLPGMIVDSYSKKVTLTPELIDNYKNQLFYLLLTASIFATIVAICVIFTFREKPGVPIWSSAASEPLSPAMNATTESPPNSPSALPVKQLSLME